MEQISRLLQANKTQNQNINHLRITDSISKTLIFFQFNFNCKIKIKSFIQYFKISCDSFKKQILLNPIVQE